MSGSEQRRWSKFWWQDWQRDPALRMCSLAARGLWMELLCIANEGQPYGHVTVNGRAPNSRQLGMIVGCTEKETDKLLEELEQAGVFSRTDAGVIYSRRMVRDLVVSDQARTFGRMGGNPDLKGGKRRDDKGPVGDRDNRSTPAADKANKQGALTPSLNLQEAEAEAEAEAEKESPPSEAHPARTGIVRDEVRAAFDAWNALARQAGLPLAGTLNDRRRKQLAARLREGGGLEAWARALAVIRGNAFLRGENDRGWRADLDFLLQPKSFSRVVEGAYDRAAGSGRGGKLDWWRREMEREYGPFPGSSTAAPDHDPTIEASCEELPP